MVADLVMLLSSGASAAERPGLCANMFASKRREVMLRLKLNLLDIKLSARAIKGSHLLIIRQQQ